MKKNTGMLNGVDVDRLFATIDAVGKETSLADFRFRAKNTWIRGGHNRSTIQGFYGAGQEDPTRTKAFVLDNDEPAVLLDEVSSTLEGDLDLRGFLGMDDSVRNGYEKIRVTFQVKGDATDEQLEELCRVAQRRSPVFDIVSNPVPVEVKLERAKAMQPAA